MPIRPDDDPRDEDELAPLGRAQLSHLRPAQLDRFWFGAVYYPEHWDRATRAADPKRMRDAGINVVRMAEFAWDLVEPEEGRLDFGLFDETLHELGNVGISAILCTPTATPPRWLTEKHPDVLRVDANGVRMQHGSRQHACAMSPTMRRYSKAITRELAEHYAGNPNVVGWQTDNELHCHFSECHCDNCQRAFQGFLRRKFGGNVGALNRAWGTAFWAQTVAAFEQILTPRDGKPTYPNPAHVLDYYRFLSDGVARFQHDQVEILRRVNPRWFVTHNGTFGHIDYRGPFTKDLDFLGYDVYPMFSYDPDERLASQAFALDRARAWSGNFIVPEQQAGPGGQAPYFHDTPEPGEMRLLTYTSIARGADSLLYFRWRTCRFGAEAYWCGILDHDDVPRRRYAEVKRIGEELQRVGPKVLGTSVFVDVAIAGADLDAHEAHATYPLGLPSPDSISREIHQVLLAEGHAVGIVHPADDLGAVKLLFIPHWTLFEPALVPQLAAWVDGGGTLVVGARTATRDRDNSVVSAPLPGCLRELLGVTVEEYGKQNRPDRRPLSLVLSEEIPTKHWYEALSCAPGTTVLGTWRGRHLDGLCSVSLRRHGKGHVVYVGTYLTTEVTRALLLDLRRLSGVSPLYADAPRGVSVVRRDAPSRRLWFFLNGTDAETTLPRTPPGTELLSGQPSGGPRTLPRHGVLVVEQT